MWDVITTTVKNSWNQKRVISCILHRTNYSNPIGIRQNIIKAELDRSRLFTFWAKLILYSLTTIDRRFDIQGLDLTAQLDLGLSQHRIGRSCGPPGSPQRPQILLYEAGAPHLLPSQVCRLWLLPPALRSGAGTKRTGGELAHQVFPCGDEAELLRVLLDGNVCVSCEGEMEHLDEDVPWPTSRWGRSCVGGVGASRRRPWHQSGTRPTSRPPARGDVWRGRIHAGHPATATPCISPSRRSSRPRSSTSCRSGACPLLVLNPPPPSPATQQPPPAPI
jgi:hypothetical protein